MNLARLALSRLFPTTEQPTNMMAPAPATDVAMAVRYIPDGEGGDLAVATITMENVSGCPCFTGHANVDADTKYGRTLAMLEATDAARDKARAAGFEVLEVQWQARAHCVTLERPLAQVLQFLRG